MAGAGGRHAAAARPRWRRGKTHESKPPNPKELG